METEARTLKVIKGHCLGGGRDAAPGDVLRVPGDLSDAEARRKVSLGYAIELPRERPIPEHVETPEVPEDPDQEEETESEVETPDTPVTPETVPGVIENRDPEPEDRDPKPGGKAKPKKPRSAK
jgi:hypothetical protein